MRVWLAIVAIIVLPCCGRRLTRGEQFRVKTVFNSSLGYSLNYYYSNQGLLDSIITSQGNKTIYRYEGRMLISRTTNRTGQLVDSSVIFLNPQNLADSLVNFDITGFQSSKKYVYDKNEFSIEERRYDRSGETVSTQRDIDCENITSFRVIKKSTFPYSIKNNVINHRKDTVFINASENEYSVYFDYFRDKIKTTTCRNYGCFELGKGSNNIEKTMVQLSAQGDTMDVTSFRYTFDSKERIISCATTSQTGGYDSIAVTYY